ncbi:uncharacterized protein LOC108253607 [Diaphorina citri]|uniref:Uncharacterized protein LOC108253607 n=1 Tax=Diaphorina citri TaxID=121845 RepID=A0A3Q0JCN9_DIACI|nr:uncharacterized protein LOC108253607 [Diaphorina citri]
MAALLPLGSLIYRYCSTELSKSDGVRMAALLPLGSLIYRYCSTELSKSDGVRVAALLPLGSLIYRYCSTVDCQEDETVRSIMRALDYSLPPFCRTYTNKDTLVTSATLKAIGNAGIYTSNLKSCMFEPIGHLEVRLNAIRSLRKVPCSDVHNSNALVYFAFSNNIFRKILLCFRSEQSCAQDFTPSSRILSSAQCEETHVLKPFSQGMQGASILVKQRLTHLVTRNSDELDLSYDDDQISGIFTTLVYATPSTSLLDTSTESSATHEDDSMLRQLLPQFAVLSKSLRVGVGDSIPDAYLEFLTSLRSVSANVMDKLLFTTEVLDRTLLLTLIAQAGTEESLDFLIQQHDYHAISDAEMNRLLPEIQTYQTPSGFSVEKLHVS